MTENRVEIDTDNLPDSRKQILAQARTHFTNAISFGDFEIEHKIKVDEVLGNGGVIDYSDGKQEIKLKRATLTRKTDKETGAFCYSLKIVVE